MEAPNVQSTNRSVRSTRFFSSLHRYKNLVRRKWWVLLITLLLGLGIKTALILTSPPTYVSTGQMTVGIKLQMPSTGGGAVFQEELSQFFGTQLAYMKSAVVQQRAADRVQAMKPELKPIPVDMQIGLLPKTAVFAFRASGSEPEYTQAYLDATMEEFINFKKELRNSTSEYTLTGITEQLASLQSDLKQCDDELLAFQESNSVVFLQEQGNSAGTYLAQLNRDLANLQSDYELLNLLNLDQNLERTDAQQAQTPPQTADSGTGANDSPTDLPATVMQSGYLKAKQDIQMLKAERQEWSQYLKPKHPRIVALSDEIARQEKLLDIYRQQGIEQLEDRRSSLALQITNVQAEIKQWEVKSIDVSKKMAEYDRIRDNKTRTQALYDRLLDAMHTLDAEKDVTPETIAIMQRATPAVFTRESLVKQLILGGGLGLLAGLAILLGIDRFDDRPTSFSELQDLFDEPVLGQIPKQKPDSKEGVGLLQPEDERHQFLESYRNVRSSLLYMATNGKRPKTIVTTSAIPGDGKSMTTANLAITLALGGSRVLLVDADLRRGRLHQRFGVDPTPGLKEVLSSGTPLEQAVTSTSITNLFLLPRGELSRNPGELFLTKQSVDLLKVMGEKFDYVIIDTAPVMAADDVTSLAPHVEGVIFVIRANHTSARVARAALDLLYQREVDVLGLIFNCVETTASEYYYYKYKDYYADHSGAKS